jgi:cytochrome c-type biogenesis protein CcsB
MIQPDILFFLITLAGYLAASILYIAILTTRNRAAGRLAVWILLGAAIAHAAAFITRWISTGHLPMVSLFEALSFYALLVVVAYLVVEKLYRFQAIGAFLTPMAFVTVAMASTTTKQSEPLAPILASVWLPIHVAISLTAYTVFTMAFVLAIIYLLQERELKSKKAHTVFYRLPPLQTMERLAHTAVAVGFPFMTLSIATGALWAEQAWGSYWSWDPKQTMALVTWLIYAFYFHLHNVVGWRGRRVSWLVVLGFASVVFTFVGVKFLNPPLHNFI